jgi:uncharacterized repeat protein (TIGR03803 family)
MRSARLIVSCLILAGCSRAIVGSLPSAADPNRGVSYAAHAKPLKFLYSFKGIPDGTSPRADLLDVRGTLYGTTTFGGGSSCGDPYGCGTVFKVKPGIESVVYAFTGGSDGAAPSGDLIDVDGVLYGTTSGGGGSGCDAFGCGTVFKLTTSGKETVVYRFQAGADGFYPLAGLIDVDGTLYGTTSYGGGGPCDGGGGCGTVFKITPSGSESVLYSFQGGSDGAGPGGDLIYVRGALYGATTEGGSACEHGSGCGTVFKITPSGAESILHRFRGSLDGRFPRAGLAYIDGALFGTTILDGSAGGGNGTVFRITLSGKESVLYNFPGGAGGGAPLGDVIGVNGNLYGTSGGGASGNGMVFKITQSGKGSAVYSFTGGSDGAGPDGSLIEVSGTLYGTTGGYASDKGSVFGISL